MSVVTLVLVEQHLDIIGHVIHVWIPYVNMERQMTDVSMIGSHHIFLRESVHCAKVLIFYVTPLLATMVVLTNS